MSSKNQHLLLFRGTSPKNECSPQELQAFMDRWMAWYGSLESNGQIVGAEPLEDSGCTVSGAQGAMVSDGPFVEAKDSVGGFFLLNVATMEEAVAIAKQCPGLDYGGTVEVRPVADHCSTARLAEAGEAEAAVSA